MKTNRRGFFGILAGALTAACVPLGLSKPSPFLPLYFKGAPFVFDPNMPTGTVGGINRATFTFWRNQPHTTLDELGREIRRAMLMD